MMTDGRGMGLLLIAAVVLLYGTLASTVGFVSDDWDLLERVSHAPFYMPIENHHYNLLINFLFKLAGKGTLSPLGIHLIALTGHLANTTLVYLIANRGFNCSPLFSWTLAFLFAVSPAGVEALAWCCAIGYIATAFWMFLGIYLFTTQVRYKPLWFALIQLMAFASWDWGMLVFPVLCILALVDKRTPVRALLPVACCWGSVLLLKKLFGFSLGYAVNPPLVFVKNILSAPLVTLLPQFSKNFYIAPMGIASALALLALLAFYSFRNRTALTMLLLFFVCQLPQAALGHPQSRYAYIAAFPLLFVLMLLAQESLRRYAYAPLSLLGIIYLLWTGERIQWWQEGFVQMEYQQRTIQELAAQHKELVVIDLPDRYGPHDRIWLPQGWRNGRNIFPTHVLFYITPENLPAYKIAGVEELSLREIRQRHPDAFLYDAS